MNKQNPIGVFDSGIGGLTVVKRLRSFMPSENIIYFGDTARVPYGTKSNDTVIEYSIQNAEFLIRKNVKMIIVACNTASSVALDELRERFDVPIIGMIEPGAQLALKKTENKKIGVIGTTATVSNKAYSHKLSELDGMVTTLEKACPLFVPLAEEGWTDHEATKIIAEEYLEELKDSEIDTLILGCTHYPILADVIQNVMGENVNLIDSGTAAAYLIEDYLHGRNLINDSNLQGECEFYVSDLPNKFKEIAERFLGRKLVNVHKIDLEELSGKKE